MENESLAKMFDMHISECDKRDVRNSKAIDEIKAMFKGIWDTQDATRAIINSMQTKMYMILGGLILAGKLLDYAFSLIGHGK